MDVQIQCICPETGGKKPHETDTVTLPDVLDFRRMLTVRQAIRFTVDAAREAGDPLSVPELVAVMAESYLLTCIDRWTCVDADGKPIPVTKATVKALLLEGDYEAAEIVGNVADDLYSDKAVLPLMERASGSLPPTPTPGPTSAPTNGSKPAARRKGSKRSSTTTSRTVGTGTMGPSLVGVSSSSLSSVSVG